MFATRALFVLQDALKEKSKDKFAVGSFSKFGPMELRVPVGGTDWQETPSSNFRPSGRNAKERCSGIKMP